jgi:dTDP-glucose 4,6-dehydratase
MKVLITGGAGFIASHLIEHLIQNTEWDIYCVDKLSYAAKGWSRLEDSGVYYNKRLTCYTWDLEYAFSQGLAMQLQDVNIIIHMAADSHVDYSIANPVSVISNNVMNTVHLLEYARKLPNLLTFHYFSTDEVFGPAPKDVYYCENDRHNPTNPYSASKSAAEDICLSYYNTYKVPVMITNLMNVIGQRQYIYNFVPLVIKKILNDEVIDIHTEKDGITPGSRFYIHARNVAAAILFIHQNGKIGEKYNITGEQEIDNLQMAKMIAQFMDKELKYKLVDFHSNRPGHDTRYSLNGDKLKALGWKTPISFLDSLRSTVQWTLKNPRWLEL